MASSNTRFMSRDDYRKRKELEEARKAGTAPAELDEEGREINPHIPQYIAEAPWYLGQDKPTLKHQRVLTQKEYEKNWYKRGTKVSAAPKKFRKGACANCGAMSHKTKLCLERPRKRGAKLTRKDMKADDFVVSELNLDYDASRDPYNGYDPNEYQKVIEKYEKIEEERKRQKKKEVNEKFMTAPDPDQKRFPHKTGKKAQDKKFADSDSDEEEERGSDDDELKLRGDEDMQGSKVDAKTRITIRNLRIREDTAKYLYNLDPKSAFYDPKTRSMRANPLPNKDPSEVPFAGENRIRNTGEATHFTDVQRFAWNSYERGQDVSLTAAPSQAELLHKQHREKKQLLMSKKKQSLIAKYGGEEYLKPAPILGQTETYVEYARDGKILTGGDSVMPSSKWEEDVLIGNHTSVWGSFWRDGQWGYACCHQFVKNAYCTGEAGKQASQARIKVVEPERKMLQPPSDKKKKEDEKNEKEEARKRFKKALEKEEKRNSKSEEDAFINRKRKYNSQTPSSYEVSQEELEAYKYKRARHEDPMRKFKGS